jgi:hypothetical protein
VLGEDLLPLQSINSCSIAFDFLAGLAHAADIESMRMKCSARAAKALRVGADAVEAKYEGQRTDMTHAVNGSAVVRGASKTFQCSFERTGRRITKFIVNAGQSSGASDTAEDKNAPPPQPAQEGATLMLQVRFPAPKPRVSPWVNVTLASPVLAAAQPQSWSLCRIVVNAQTFSTKEKL